MTDTVDRETNAVDAGSGGALDRGGIAEKVERGIKRRYAAERRFRLYGLIAIGLALGFLVVLFGKIISEGASAFVQTEVRAEVTFERDTVDPKGDGSVASIKAGSYRGLARDAFRALVPGVEGRKDKRALYDLLSGGADLTLLNAVLDDPSRIGTTEDIWLTLSDDADVYAKGRSTEVSSRLPDGTATPSGTKDTVEIAATGAAFAPILSDVKDILRARAAKVDERIAQQQLREAELGRDIGAGRNVERAESDLAATREEIAKLRAEAADLRRRAGATDGSEALDGEMPSFLVAINGGVVKVEEVGADRVTGTAFLPLASVNDAPSGEWEIVTYETPENARRLSDKQVTWLHHLESQGLVAKNFNTTFFTAGDSREPEQAGIRGAVMGSLFTLVVTLVLSFPIGVMTAVYLEEFAPKNRFTDIIEVNINNLAAVPSIVFGLLGLAMFLNFFGLPRSAPLVGGMVLTLMTLPTIIIASRAALKAVPPSIREAALGMGASRLQAMLHHVLPLAMPGMLTGTIIGMAQALGETAPLLMIGMVAFIVDVPGGFTDPATVLPVQIYLWADSPERAFVERTSAAIMVLLGFLIAMNLIAIVLRKRFERRW